MPIEIKIPEVGESITEVQISEWLKKEGDTVKADEPVAVIDSEKTTFELPAPKDGVLTRILHQSGETIRVGEVVAQIDADGQTQKTEETAAKPKAESEKAEKATEKPRTQKPSQQKTAAEPRAKESDPEKQSEPEKAESQKGDQRRPKPQAEPQSKPAQGEKPRPDGFSPSPPLEGRVGERRLSARTTHETQSQRPHQALAAGPSTTTPSSDREEEIVPMTMLRRTVARRLVEAQQTMAMLTTFSEADMSAVQALRKEHQEAFQKRYNVKLGLMSFFAKATVDALKQFPAVNAEIRGNDIVYRNYYDLGIAIASERGLVVPVLRNADRLSFAETEKAIAEFARLAREGNLRPEDLAGGTFTISNGGVYGSLLSTPIINPPQSAILGLHAIQERPVAVQGQVAIRPMMYLALTYDHRLVDGREAVLFLRRIKESIESPSRLLLEI